ncbi:zinc transporter ZntB [Thiotrichales bacterium 19S11-10]|nr:zinc transporter ZntB [Thiotrichales bacterium 19S11-10]MCF6807018.1 zinc transporter ZntB [Thiotrichales bacterium 19S9-11]MCF6810987.1 zinc transporter ZntB [Thiotrichales bacterium 19S9-12]
MSMTKKITIFSLDKKGSAKEIAEDQWQKNKGLIWIRLDLNAAKDFLKKIEISPLAISILSAQDTRPRTLMFDDYLLGSFRGVNLNKSSAPEDMISVRVLIKNNLIITVQRRNLLTTNEIENLLLHNAGPKSSSEFLEILLATLTDKSSDVSALIDGQLDEVEDELHNGVKIINKHHLNDIRRRVITLRRYLVPQREAINRINADKLSWLDPAHSLRLHETSDSCIRIIEDLDAMYQRATILHEELSALTQEKINQKMYLLSIVAVIFMPISFITGLLGINVGGIPGAEFGYGFFTVCIILLFVITIQIFYLRKKHWI